MNAINNFNVLPFYTSLAKQNGKKWYAFGNIYPLASPRDKILPFQIVMASTVASVSALTIHNYKTGATIASGLTPTIYTPEGQSYSIIYLKLSTISQLAEGRYYLTITVDGTTLYSEIFNAISDLSEYVKIEYWNEDDLYTKDKIQVYFGNDFKFVMYACTDIGKPEYLFEEELTKRLGYKFLESQVSNKVYKFTFLAPEYLTDSMRIIRLSDYIKLTQGDEEFNALTFAYDAKWEQQGDLASVECEFETDTIIQKLQSFNRRQLESFYNALLSNIDEPILFDTEVVAQYYADFQTGGLIQGKLIHELELETELKEGAFIPIDNNDSTPAKRISVSLLTASSHTHTNKALLDLITQSAIDVLSHLSVVDDKVKVDVDFWSTGEISAYGGGGATVGGGTGSSSLGGLVNVGVWADETPISDRIMVQLAGATHWSSKLLSEVVGLDTIALGAYLTTNNYSTKAYVDAEIAAKTHTHENKSTLDLITQNHLDLLSHLSLVDGRIKVDVDFWSTGEISAYGSGATGGGASGSLGELANVGLWANEVPTSSRIMVQVVGETHWSSKLLSEVTGLDAAALGSYLTTNGYSKQSYVDTRIAELVASSPSTLDTLNELAMALGNDPNFATSMTTLIGTKWTQDNTKIANWDSAFGALHSHANKSVLDGVTSELVTNWNLAYTNNHTHSNKAIIDNLTQANLDVLAKLSIVDGNLKVDTNFWSTGEVSAYGAGSGTGGGGTGLITSVLGSSGLGGSYLDSDLTNTFNAYTINLINGNLTSALGRIGALETSTPNVAWGTPTSQYSPLTINSATRNLSLDGHTHSSFLDLELKNIQGGDINHRLELGYTSRDYVNWYEYGGLWKFIQKQGAIETELLQINPVNILYKGNAIWHAGNFNPSSYLPLSGGTLSSTSTSTVLAIDTTISGNNVALRINGTDKVNIGYVSSGAYAYYANKVNNNEIQLLDGAGVNDFKYAIGANKYTVWHAGNDGRDSGLDAGLLCGRSAELYFKTRVGYMANINDQSLLVDNSTCYWNPDTVGKPNNGYGVLLNISDDITWFNQFGFGTDNSIYFRQSINSPTGFGAWKTLAFTDSNVASATKLANTRTIWGQSFNGEGNVTGALSGATTGTFSSTISATTGIFSNLTANYIPKHTTGGLTNSLVYDNGTYVGINRTDAAYNLDVNGTFRSVGAGVFNSTLNVGTHIYLTGDIVGVGNLYTTGGNLYVNSTSLVAYNTGGLWLNSGWYRSWGATGWRNESYNAGVHSDTANIVRTFETNKFKVYNTESDSITTLGGINATTGAFSSYVTANRFYTGYDAGTANSFSCSNWFRSNGASGWYNETYGAGINSDTANVVRTYSTNKFKVYNTEIDSIYTLGGLKADQISTLKGISVTNGSYAKGISIGFNSHMQIDGIVSSYTYNLPATIGWYRVAVSPSGVERPSGQFDISWTLSSYYGSLSLTAGTMYASAPFISQTAYSNFGTCITKSRIVYNTTYSGTYAYLEIYNETGKAVSLTVRGYNLTGWSLYSASTVGSIPSGYSNKEISHISGYMTSGNVAALGEVTAYSASDIRLKTEIVSLSNSLQIIDSLNPVSYKWNSLAKELNPLKNDNTDYGLIAQELEVVMPELVHTIYGQYKSVDYVKIIPHLICAIKQLKSEIDMLKS